MVILAGHWRNEPIAPTPGVDLSLMPAKAYGSAAAPFHGNFPALARSRCTRPTSRM